MEVLLKLLAPSCIYKQLLGKLNLIYTVTLISKAGFEDLAFVIPSAGTVFNISKIIIFVDLIDKAIEMVKYLQSKLFKHIKTLK